MAVVVAVAVAVVALIGGFGDSNKGLSDAGGCCNWFRRKRKYFLHKP
jgi:hypothetical protein